MSSVSLLAVAGPGGQGFLDWLANEANRAETLIILLTTVAGIALIALALWKHRTLVPVLTMAVVVGVVLFAVRNTSWFSDHANQEFNQQDPKLNMIPHPFPFPGDGLTGGNPR